ncbi:MAG: TonB-dependent receptor plug domain-containing protein [Gemmatimonadaceae bacterium]|nr:TonB-dependent receptor plug domain-containing protein [Gemmatimonadaceae bacterium]
MITALMLYALAIGVLVALGAVVLDHAARAARVSRRFVWFGALALLVALTVSAPWRLAPSAPIAVSTESTAAPAIMPVRVAAEPAWPVRLRDAVQTSMARAIGDLATRVPASLDRTLGVLWLLATTASLTLLALLLRRLDAQRKRWPRARLLGTTVRVGEADGPAVYGVFVPDIVVPRALLSCDTSDQALVLAHEDEHRRARDPLLLATATTLVALLPWHPLAWWCLARLRLATELDCDARVLQRGVSAHRYGHVLLSLASSLPVAPRAAHALALFDTPRHLERRLLAMTSPRARRSPFLASGLALVGIVLIAAACNTDVPTAADVRDADVAAVTKTLGLPSAEGAVQYTVDGQSRSAAEARAVAADQIESIEVQRGVASGMSTVHIRTRRADGASTPLTVPGQRIELVVDTVAANGIAIVADTIVAFRTDSSRVLIAGRAADTTLTERRVRLLRNGTAGDTVVVRGSRQPLLIEELRVADSSMTPLASGTTRVRVREAMRDTSRTMLLRVGQAPGDTSRVYYDPQRSATVVGRQIDSSRTTAQPLIVIDGVIAEGSTTLNSIRPEHIQSIEVIKGAAAQSLYGARGANGVIKVTTKQ